MNNLSFTGNFRFYQTSANYKNCEKALDKLYTLESPPEFSIYENFINDKNLTSKGVYQCINVCADDIYDRKIESILKQRNINFEHRSLEEIFDPDCIFNRIKLSESQKESGKRLVAINTAKFDKIFQNEETYISHGGKNGIGNRYNKVQEYIKTGLDIDPSEIYLKEEDGKLYAAFQDGRHRYAYLRDWGLAKIPFAMTEESFLLAEKYGLIAQ